MLTLGRLRQKECDGFKASLGYTVRPSQNNKIYT